LVRERKGREIGKRREERAYEDRHEEEVGRVGVERTLQVQPIKVRYHARALRTVNDVAIGQEAEVVEHVENLGGGLVDGAHDRAALVRELP
jgi:hypothetical protein